MKFMNIGPRFYNAAGADGAGAGGGGQGGGEGGQGGQGGQGQQQPIIDYAALAAAIVAAQQGGQGGQGGKSTEHQESAYERMKREEAERNSDKATQAELRAQVAFDMGFDDLMKANQSLFGTVTAAKIRESAAGLEGADLIHHLRCVSVQAFLANEANHLYLNPADLAYAKSAIIGKHERQIDSAKAWEIIERGLHVAGVKARADALRENGGGASTNDMPNLSAWIIKCKNRFAHHRNKQQ